MALAYNQSCPTLYQPPGFVDEDEFQEGDAQAMCDSLVAGAGDVVGVLETGHHEVRITVRLADAEAQDSSIDLHDIEMSKQLQAMQKTSSSYSNNLLSTLKESTPAAKRRTDAPIPSGKRVKAIVSRKLFVTDAGPRVTRAGVMKAPQTLKKPSCAQLVSDSPRDSSVEFFAATKDSLKGTSIRLAVTKLTELLVHCYAVQNGKAGGGDVFDGDLLAEGKIKRLSRSSDISCECGSPEGSSGMVRISSPCALLQTKSSALLRSMRRSAA